MGTEEKTVFRGRSACRRLKKLKNWNRDDVFELKKGRGVYVVCRYACINGEQEVTENQAINQDTWIMIIIITFINIFLCNIIYKDST